MLFVKPEKNAIFLKKGKMVICRYSIFENLKFFRSRMMKWTLPLELSREI